MQYNWNRKTENEPLTVNETDGVVYLTFPALADTGLVKHGFSTRIGGISEGKYATMNFAFTRGDNPGHVQENYRRMAGALDVDVTKMVLSRQTHTVNIKKVTAEDAGSGILRERDYQDIDGLITDIPGITLVTFYADCVPLYLVDPVNQAIGLSHSGWRGTVSRMGRVTIEAMTREYGTRAKDLIVGIGPSICQDCFEVGEEVVEEFRAAFDRSCHDRLFYRKDNGRYQLDLWFANEVIFKESGVAPERIHITDICTHCNPDRLFSHRVQGNERGNLAAFLSIRE